MNRTIRAIFSAAAPSNAQQPDTPMVGAWSLIVKHKGELREVVTVRTYYNRKGTGMQPVRACIWVNGVDNWRSGKGSASGCGYHKASAAVADAVKSAGITLYGDPYARERKSSYSINALHFGGTGESAYREIFTAIARAAGYRIPKGGAILVSH